MDRLARFTDVMLDDPATFGGGSGRAHARTRVTTVAYGYLGVVEEYEEPEQGTIWCLLTVALPGLAPRVAVDHRSAFGRPGVPADGELLDGTGDHEFDAMYSVVARDHAAVARTLTAPVRALLVSNPVQRLEVVDGNLTLRSFDGAAADDAMIGWLNGVVESVLSCTPSFVSPRSGRKVVLPGRPLPPGLHALPEPSAPEPARPERTGLVGRLSGRVRPRP